MHKTKDSIAIAIANITCYYRLIDHEKRRETLSGINNRSQHIHHHIKLIILNILSFLVHDSALYA